eukprot:8689995-Pyramimonas_sp.AAC.1
MGLSSRGSHKGGQTQQVFPTAYTGALIRGQTHACTQKTHATHLELFVRRVANLECLVPFRIESVRWVSTVALHFRNSRHTVVH